MFSDNKLFKAEKERLLTLLHEADPESEEYQLLLSNYQAFLNAESSMKDQRLSRDAIFGGVVSLLGIGAVIGYEKGNVILSKAFSLISKARV